MILGYISYRKWKSMTVAVFPFSSFLFKTWSIKWKRQSLSRVRLFGIPWAVVCQDPLSMEFSRQEYWSGVPFPSPGDLPDPGIKSWSPAYEGGFFTFWATREAQRLEYNCFQYCVSTVQQSESAIHIPLSSLSRISSPPSHLHPSRSSQSNELSSLLHTAGSYWPSVTFNSAFWRLT